MPKKKELPRKRKRFWKKVLFFSSLITVVFIVGAGVLYYHFFVKSSKPEFISPLSVKTVAQAKQEDTSLAMLKVALEKENIAYSSVTNAKDGSLKVVLEKGGEVT